MDTPEKAQIGTPGYNFEESPFSNFINTLSPIKSSKSIPISQTLGSLTFTSPPSVFTSPHVSLQRESTFLRRHLVSELAKAEFSSGIDNKDAENKDTGNAAKSPTEAPHEVQDADPSKDEVSADAPREASNLAIELPRELKYDCGSPDLRTAPSSGSELKSEPGTSSRVPLFQEASRDDSLRAQLGSVETDKNMDASSCEWSNLIPDAADLLIFESPQVQGTPTDSEKQSIDEQIDLFASLLSHYPEDDDVNGQEQQHGLGPPSSSDLLLQSKEQITQQTQVNELQQIYQGEDCNASSSCTASFSGQAGKKIENQDILHRGVRRRCLVFEIPGAKKSVGRGTISISSLSQDEANTLSIGTQSAIRQGGDSSNHIRPGIGLHLNALSVTSKGGNVLKPESLSSEKQLITVPPTTGSENFISSAIISSDELGKVENEVQVEEDASQASAHGSNEDLHPSSPKKKRRRPENTGEGEACKRCNCKKSKCLKLYCECFAAGVYCIEPCACRECFNKPIHEETVLATRKQIESRNPLAFAPKVIRSSDSVNDLVDDSNKTPASARHKRGCNCKKSNCLKKYCECYQGGVGCSINCRCESCKNTFGRKDGFMTIGRMELEMVEEDTPARESIADERTTSIEPEIHNDEDHNPRSRLPKTPLRLFRSSMSFPSSSKGKPPRFVGLSSCSQLNPDGPGRSTFLRTQHKTDQLPQDAASGDELPAALQNTSPSSTIKTLSPNSKRISPSHHDCLGHSPPGPRSSSRKLILQSIPSFPSLTPRR